MQCGPKRQGSTQGLVLAGQASAGLELIGLQVPRIAAQGPQGPFKVGTLALERAAHFVDGFPGHDHQMKTVIDDLGPGKVFAHPFGVTMQHVHGDPLNALAIPAVSSQGLIAKLKAAGTLPRRVRVRSCKYLNNIVEQDHRRIKQRIRPMIGFKRFDTSTVTIRGIELAEKIKKDQFNLERLVGKQATAPKTWAAVLAA